MISVLGFSIFCPFQSIFSNSLFNAPQIGHSQSSGKSSKPVPGPIPLSGSPTAGSYTYSQTVHLYLVIFILLVQLQKTTVLTLLISFRCYLILLAKESMII